MTEIPSNPDEKKALLEYLYGYITLHKRQLFDEVLRYRTRYLSILLEDIYQSHNASAVLRSCDLTGVQDVHIYENQNIYQVNPDVALGSAKWLNLYHYSSVNHTINDLYTKFRKLGYRIVATTPQKAAVEMELLEVDQPLMLVFGTEQHGLSQDAIDLADAQVRIPMVGFTESFNISVSAALLLYQLTHKIRNSSVRWELSEDEKTDICIKWALQLVKKPELHIRYFMNALKGK